MTGKVGLRLRQAAAVGVLAAFVVGGSVVSASAAEATYPPEVVVKPGDSFTLQGGGCTFEDGDGADYPGLVGVGLFDLRDVEEADPEVITLPNVAQADKYGDWTVTNVVPVRLSDGDYGALPVCVDTATSRSHAIPDSAVILRVRRPTTPGTTPPEITPPPDFEVPPSVPGKVKPKPSAVKVKPAYTG
jgi:hypothetical protein